MVGLIQYCWSAFEWRDDVPKAEFATLVSQLNAVANESARSIPGKRVELFPPIRNRLLQLMVNRPWAYSDPATILSDKSCLVMVTDASATAVAVSLFRVLKADASTVVNADLLDSSLSRLVAVTRRKRNAAQCKWLTFEAELHAIVVGCSKFGGVITTATVKYPPGGVPKLLILSDSITALDKWKKIPLPGGVTEHLSAKARRFNSWADKVANTRY